MIKISTLAERLQNKLNNEDFNFKVFTDTGNFYESIRTDNAVNEVINSLLTITSSDVGNLTNGSIIATIDARFDIVLPVESLTASYPADIDATEEMLLALRLQGLRDYIDGAFSNAELIELEDEDDTPFLTSVIYSISESGTRQQLPQIGDSFTFTVFITYILVQDGVNSRNYTFTLDGIVFPYQSMTQSRTAVLDANVYADSVNGATKNVGNATNFMATFELPALTSISQVLDFVLDGELNTAHILNVDIKSKTKSYLVTISEARTMGAGIQNIGTSVTFLEAPHNYELVNLPTGYKVYEVTATTNLLYASGSSKGYNFTSRQFFDLKQGANTVSVSIGDIIATTSNVLYIDGIEVTDIQEFEHEEQTFLPDVTIPVEFTRELQLQFEPVSVEITKGSESITVTATPVIDELLESNINVRYSTFRQEGQTTADLTHTRYEIDDDKLITEYTFDIVASDILTISVKYEFSVTTTVKYGANPITEL